MGWLRDLMISSDPPVPSFGRLADAALQHPAWPDETRPKPRSLAALFSKIDRGQDLEWLTDRPEVQRILAELMGRPVADLGQSLAPTRSALPDRIVRLRDVRYAREVDLVREPLLPGFPAELTEPPLWGALFWKAPSGAGRSLAGAWLRARGLASYVTVTRELDPAELPPRGPLFVEVTEESPGLRPGGDWFTRLGAATRPVCVAAPDLPHDPRFRVVTSPPIDEVLPALADWVENHLSGEGHFDAERAEAWVRRVALPARAIGTLGDALGLLGLLDEVRPRTLHGQDLDEVVESFVRKRLTESSEQSTLGPWLKRHAYPALLGTMARLITESSRPWSAPRNTDEWLELIPPEHRQGVDLEWMQAAFSQSAPHRLRPSDVTAAARRLPPGGFRLLRAFEHARLLTPVGEERSVLGPHFLGRVLHARATDKVLDVSPFSWGEALLEPAHAPGVARALFERATRADWDAFYATVDLDDPHSPAHAAALEMAATTAGLAALCGSAPPDDLADDLFGEMDRLSLRRDDEAPAARVPHPSPLGEEEPLLDSDAWLLAALSLSEVANPRKSPLSPWTCEPGSASHRTLATKIAPRLSVFLERLTVGRSLTTGKPPPWSLAAFSLFARLRRTLGPLSEATSFAERPALVVERALGSGLDSRSLLPVLRMPSGPSIIARVASELGSNLERIAPALWRALGDTHELPSTLLPGTAEDVAAPDLWRCLSPADLRRRVERRLPVRWDVLLPHQIASALQAAPLSADASRTISRSSLTVTLETWGIEALDRAAYPVAWQRCPEHLTAVFGRLFDERSFEGLGTLVDAVPDEQAHRIVHVLSTRGGLTSFPPAVLGRIRNLLARLVAHRVDDWRRAYTLLAEIESSLEPLRGKSSPYGDDRLR